MWLTVGVVVVGGMGGGWLLRKGWHGFHKAVGIRPGTMYYRPTLPYVPTQICLDLTEAQILSLPVAARQQLHRIDDKVSRYQAWQKEQREQGRTPATSENHVVLSRLLNEHLPQLLQDYLSLQQLHSGQQIPRGHEGQGQPHREGANENGANQSPTDAKTLLAELLDNIETRLDALLAGCADEQMQHLKVMKRYLDAR